MRLAEILFIQGFGSRRECAALIASGAVGLLGRALRDGDEELALEGLVLDIDGQPWPCHRHALLMMHKPAGYECSRQPQRHPSVLSLLPPPLRRRGVQPVGRLDQDTTGLLLLTDDGALLHRLTHPRRHVAKVYEVQTRHPVDEAQVRSLLAGVVLHDDPEPVRAAACAALGSHTLQLSIAEGRYHQVKRMVAAAGNRVEALHRSAFGSLALAPDLQPGQWRWLDGAQRGALLQPAAGLSGAAASPAGPG